MWLFIPSTSSASALAEEALIGPSSWQSQLLAQSCAWRGKHSPSLIWSRRCNAVSWLRRLSTVMCEPSLADASVATWMASLEASPASPTASPESGLAGKTSATFGDRPVASSSNRARGSSSSRTSAACSPKGVPSEFEETFSAWAARLRAASSARRKLASRMSGNGSSSSASGTAWASAWPTPRASEAGPDFAKADRSATGMALPAAAVTMANDLGSARPTPAARDFKGVDRTEIDRGNARPLNEVVAHWPTPQTVDSGSSRPFRLKKDRASRDPAIRGSMRGDLKDHATAWPTPVARDGFSPHSPEYVAGKRLQGHGMANLNDRVSTWSTPRASDGEKGGPGQSFGAGGAPLAAQASGLSVSARPTPTALDRPRSPETLAKSATFRKRNANQNTVPLYLGEVAQNWMTPVANDTGTRTTKYAQGGTALSLQTGNWQTPSVADVTGGHASRSGARKNELLLNGQAEALSSSPALATPTAGAGSPTTLLSAYLRYRATTDSALRSERRSLLLMAIRRRDRPKRGEIRRLRRGWTKTAPSAFVRPSFRRSLNPLFVGDLMGWPPGLTSFACSEMASSIWRERMRSALSQLTSHAAPPAQLNLFG
jgi:hypothetical protein